MLHIRPSTRNRAKIKLALQGCAGSGKTYSALLLAYGMTSDWSKIAVIDSENGLCPISRLTSGPTMWSPSVVIIPLRITSRPSPYVKMQAWR